PALRQDNKAFVIVASQHRRQEKTAMQEHPCNQVPAIGPIDPNAAQLFASSSQAFEQHPGAFGIGDAGSSHDHSQEQAHGINQKMALATGHLFSGIVAAHSPMGRGLDALTVQGASRRRLVPPGSSADAGSQLVMDALPASILAPASKVRIAAL